LEPGISELTDPLWAKLDGGFDEDVPAMLGELAASWDDDTADMLFHGVLWHQHSCYGATYAAVPHLLEIADREENQHQRLEIALFLALVALDSRGQLPDDPPADALLQGLPETIEGWDSKLDCYRHGLARLAENPDQPHSENELKQLAYYKEVLATPPVDADDLTKILSIKAGFYQALPAIRALCERLLLEDPDEDAVPYLLSGVAAVDGLLSLARHLNCGDSGTFQCGSCGWGYEFVRYGEQIALYADNAPGTPRVDKAVEDYKDGAPLRADGFLAPITESEHLDARISALLSLAKRAPSPVPALLVRHFAGSFVCCKCVVQGPMATVESGRPGPIPTAP